ncbi:MAG: 30S ribosomal protein S2 [Candidatus Niyogibacteria bacterium CG10_big_fil_rev_8_21_14_0_10_42_19]|uniref:Small ribosomal subunit protein uS2 n=1 Tax=Candidatus Niyogibacteria bacterium CG10_big_fil_rev_8_21_14_0_10_42_19 TaxID=1974725 RepID=A0A2H0TEZ7_9BACT|nr:MAG: 30S ribosomal protein S2 [Candidatus Niyogibacteria bacterium CG10_big_fil_rev_8_21_14_0_10_42_19]
MPGLIGRSFRLYRDDLAPLLNKVGAVEKRPQWREALHYGVFLYILLTMSEIELELKDDAQPSVVNDPELEIMLKAGLHFGYSRSKRHPKMKPYIFGQRNGVEVFDLEKVRDNLKDALAFIAELSGQGKNMILVGTKVAARGSIEKAARDLGLPYVSNRWIGGTLTNFNMIRKRIDYFENLKEDKKSGALEEKYTKKEVLRLSEKIIKLEVIFGGVASLKKLPDALFIVDPEEEITAVREARRLSIPIIGLASNDNNPDEVTYLIPGNDSSRASINFIIERVSEAWQKGKANII